MSKYGIRKASRHTFRSIDNKWYDTLEEAIEVATRFDNPVGFTVFLHPNLTKVARLELVMHDRKDFWVDDPCGELRRQFADCPYEVFDKIVLHVQGIDRMSDEKYQKFLSDVKKNFPDHCHWWIEEVMEPIDPLDTLRVDVLCTPPVPYGWDKV